MTDKLLRARKAWLMLLAISAISFLAAELVSDRRLAIVAIMAIAAIKIGIILSRFMEVSQAPLAIRRYLQLWTIGVAVIVIVMWQMSAG